MSRLNRKTVKLDPRERSSEFKKVYEITGVVGVGGGGTVYAGTVYTDIYSITDTSCLY